MAREIIRQGDPTSHGGVVLEGSLTDICHGKPISCIGHRVQCPKCKGVFPIVEGVLTTTFFGKGVAVAGMKTACGASLIPTQFTDTIECGGGGGDGASSAESSQDGPVPRASWSSGTPADTAGPDAGKITHLYWSYGLDEIPVNDVSRHYVDLNLHIETENYNAGDIATVIIKKNDDSASAGSASSYELRIPIGADGAATVRGVFRNKTLEIGTIG